MRKFIISLLVVAFAVLACKVESGPRPVIASGSANEVVQTAILRLPPLTPQKSPVCRVYCE